MYSFVSKENNVCRVYLLVKSNRIIKWKFLEPSVTFSTLHSNDTPKVKSSTFKGRYPLMQTRVYSFFSCCFER